jgi:glutathione S-transferase
LTDPGPGLTVYQIPVCPFSQRLRILLELKRRPQRVRFEVVDITKPRADWLLELGGDSTELPILRTEDGGVLRESLVILRYLDDRFPEPAVLQRDPYRRAVENMLIAMEGEFTAAGYRLVMNQDRSRRDVLCDVMLGLYARLDRFLRRHAPDRVWLFETFGFAEAVYAPIFMRFWFLAYYEDFELPPGPAYERVRRWRDACIAHPAAQQVSREEIVKSYYDYARGAGNGALLPGRSRSSFAFEPHWSARPWPPQDKYRSPGASDAELGLID